MTEKEVRGFLSKEDFLGRLNEISAVLGEPTKSKRLSIGLGNYDDLNLETKIRITNGKLDITQKLGALNSIDREEITVFLDLEAKDILNLYKTYHHFTTGYRNPMRFIIQHENYIFENERFEIKLFKQFGKTDFFAFEVESLVEMEDQELIQFCRDLDLIIADNYNDKDIVEKRNREVNLNPDELSDEEFIKIIESYLHGKI